MTLSGATPPPHRLLRFPARDGLTLAAYEWDATGPSGADRTPILCLPGLTRTGLDYGDIAVRHARERRVVALDTAGHGESGRVAGSDLGRYRIEEALRDLTDALAALHLHRVVVVGTSFGGLLAMALAALRPAVLRGVVLNDIGPKIDAPGREFVRDFVAADPALPTLDDAAEHLRRVLPPISLKDDAAWRRFAELTYARGADGKWHPRWDTRLAQAMDATGELPDLWPLFGALAAMPAMLVWGERSEILSRETMLRMRRQHRGMEFATAPGTGHAPLLIEPEVAPALDAFLRAIP